LKLSSQSLKKIKTQKDKKYVFHKLLHWTRGLQLWQPGEKFRPKLHTSSAQKCENNQNVKNFFFKKNHYQEEKSFGNIECNFVDAAGKILPVVQKIWIKA